jgi:hypothetical protein
MVTSEARNAGDEEKLKGWRPIPESQQQKLTQGE